MADPVWYRSLYWRIALGFVALVAVLLAAQGTVFLWMTGQMAQLFPGRSPDEFAQTIAAELVTTLSDRADTDIDTLLNTKFASAYRAFAVVMTDNRVVISKGVKPPPNITWAVYGRLMGEPDGPGRGRGFGRGGDRGPGGGPPDRFDRGPGGGSDRGQGPDRGGDSFRDHGGPGRPDGARGEGPARPDGLGPGGRPDGPGGRGGITFKFAPVIVSGNQIGMVAVPSEPPPWSVTMREVGPTLAAVAIGLLIVGTAVGALVVVRPVRRRLHSLEAAAKAIGAGQLSARAPEIGGDEVSALARTFNEMAGELEARTTALTVADRTRRQLLADISHELSTPLAAIRGYVETLDMKDLGLDEATKARYLNIVGEEAIRLEHIVGDLLDLAKLEGGGGTIKREPVSMAALFARVADRHDPTLRGKSIALTTTIAPDAESVIGDVNRLEQALQNLVANAARHTPIGGRIDVAADRVDAGVRISVEDSGPGIPAEHLPHVFDRFYKVDVSRTGTKLPSGSGLGLSIVQAIVARHGGTITAANAAGNGARFEITLPISDT